MYSTEQIAKLEQLRRVIKVMSAGQVINREEMGRDKSGFARLHPSNHIDFVAFHEATHKSSGDKHDPSWRDFVPEGFEDKRAEHLPDYLSRMKWKQITHVKMRQLIRGHLLAYAYLRGQHYRDVEPKAFEPPKMDVLFETICSYIDTDKTRNDVVRTLADWLLDSETEVPEDDWQSVDNMRYRLRNISQGNHADTGLPKFEAMKAAQKAASLEAARATKGKSLN